LYTESIEFDKIVNHNPNLYDDSELMSELFSYLFILLNKLSKSINIDFHTRTLYSLSLDTNDYDKQKQCAIDAIITRSKLISAILICSFVCMCISYIFRTINILGSKLRWSPIKKLSGNHMKKIINKIESVYSNVVKNAVYEVLDVIKAHDYINKNLQFFIKKDYNKVFEYINNFSCNKIVCKFENNISKLFKVLVSFVSKNDFHNYIESMCENIYTVEHLSIIVHPINYIIFPSKPESKFKLSRNINASLSSVSNIVQSSVVSVSQPIEKLSIACNSLSCMKYFHAAEQFVEMNCSNKCTLRYHLSCFRDIVVDVFRMNHNKLKRATWGKITCPASDCNGIGCKIVQMDDYKNIRCIILDIQPPIIDDQTDDLLLGESKNESNEINQVALLSIQTVNNKDNDQIPHTMLYANWQNKINNTPSQDCSSSSSSGSSSTSLLPIKNQKTQHLEEFHQSLANAESNLEGRVQLVQPQHINVSHSPSKYIYLNLCAEGITSVAITQINTMNPTRSLSYPLTGKPIGVVFEFESAIEAEEIVIKLPELSLCYVNLLGCHLNFRASFLRHAK
jgi:hypothetical protein